jgi:hypothetical protein
MPRPWPTTPPTAAQRAAYADARTTSFWLDDLPARAADPPLAGVEDADLCIVGGGFTGLWAALHAKHDDPARDVVVLEADRAGAGASGRNGGFLVASLTHGIGNGLARFPGEMATLERLAFENFDGIKADLAAHGIDAQLEETGELDGCWSPTRSTRPRRRRRCCAPTATRSRCSTARRCAPRSPRRPTAAASGTAVARGSCIRDGWPPGCARRRCAPACASTSTRRRRG